MPIHKPFDPNNTGVKADYWEVVSLRAETSSNLVHVVVNGWLSKKAKEEGKGPLHIKSYNWSITEMPMHLLTSVIEEKLIKNFEELESK